MMTANVIERLRGATNTAGKPKLTLAQARVIVDALCSGHESLSDTAVKAGLTEDRVLDVVAELGTWLTHVNGGSSVVAVPANTQVQGVLFQAASLGQGSGDVVIHQGRVTPFDKLTAMEQAKAARLTRAQRREVSTALKKGGEAAGRAEVERLLKERAKGKKGRKGRPSRVVIPTSAVLIPPGYEKTAAHKRDVTRALCAVVESAPDDESLTRFLARHYGTQAKVMSFPIVTQVWLFARLGRLDEIDQVSPDSPVFAELLVDAHDLLEVARKDAIEALDTVVQITNVSPSDLETLAHTVRRAYWLAEAELSTLLRRIEAATHRASALSSVEHELRWISQRVQRHPKQYMVDSIAQLSLGQIRRIAQAAGLDVDNDERQIEANVRNRLKELGLSSDLDQLVPAGVKATKAGRDEDFFEILQARRRGETDWHIQLEELFGSLADTTPDTAPVA